MVFNGSIKEIFSKLNEIINIFVNEIFYNNINFNVCKFLNLERPSPNYAAPSSSSWWNLIKLSIDFVFLLIKGNIFILRLK